MRSSIKTQEIINLFITKEVQKVNIFYSYAIELYEFKIKHNRPTDICLYYLHFSSYGLVTENLNVS